MSRTCGLVLLLLLGVTACTSDSPTSTGSDPESEVAAAATETSSATVAPSPTATPEPSPSATVDPPPAATPEPSPSPAPDPLVVAAAAVDGWQTEYNDLVRVGGQPFYDFVAQHMYPRGEWTPADAECSYASGGEGQFYDDGDIRLQLFFDNIRARPDWVVPDDGQFGGGDVPGEGTFVFDVELAGGGQGQMHLHVEEDGRILMFPAGANCEATSSEAAAPAAGAAERAPTA